MLAGVVVGVVLVIPFTYFALESEYYTHRSSLGEYYVDVYAAIFEDELSVSIKAILILLSPYIVVQFGRSTKWAIKEAK